MVTLAVYSPVFRSEFINFDDDLYVTDNPHVNKGLTAQGLAWAFNVGYAGNWHPLTWISHMLDYQLYGGDSAGHHATSLFFHLTNTILMFLVLKRMLGSVGKSAFVAGLFALHPLHVESVAWVAERKDVLSALFWILTMGAYVLYAERPSRGRYIAVIALFALGLMAKPMLITLPIVLLLLDYWPLGRMEKVGLPRLVKEKIPLLALSALSCVVTLIAQHREGFVVETGDISPGIRAANAVVAYAAYIGKMIIPRNLACFYPHPEGSLAAWQVVGSASFLIAMTFLAIHHGRKRRYLAVGWLWYVITLIPVIGLVQVGRQAMADRYTYVPLIGLFLIVAFGVADLFRNRDRTLATVRVAIMILLIILTSRQVGYWQNNHTLYEHALKVTRNNCLAHINLGQALQDEGRFDEAVDHIRESLRLKGTGREHFSLGSMMIKLGRSREAEEEFRLAISLNPEQAMAHLGLGRALEAQGKLDVAMSEYRKAIIGDPDMPNAYYNLGKALEKQGDRDDATEQYRKALDADPEFMRAAEALARLQGS